MDAKATKPVWIRTKRFPPNLYRHRNGRYYLRTFSGGKEKWASLKTDILEVAKSKLRDHMDRIAAFRVSGIRQVSGPLGFEQALAIFMGQLNASAKRPNTKAFYEAGAKLVQRTWPDIVSAKLPSLTALDVQTWLQCFVANAKPHVPPRAKSPARTSSGASVTTLKCALGTLRKILDIAVLSGHLPSNPARHANVASTMKELIGKIDREQSERGDSLTLPSRQDFGKLVELVRNAGVSDCRAAADYIEFIAYCGARKNEAINVEWRDIDFRKGSIRLRVTKNGKVRHPPMFGSMRTLLERLKCERGQTRQNDPVLLVKEAQGFITSACRKLGIPRFTTHGLRHYFGTTCLELGVDAPTVAKWLGHKDKGALLLKIYAHVRPDHEKRMIQKVDLGGFGTMGHMNPERLTAMSHESAERRFHQGAFYLMDMAAWSDKEFDPKDVMGVVSVMAYLGAYAYPDANLYHLRQAMMTALEFLKPKMDVELLVNRATEMAEVFRRPWTEEPPRDQAYRTI